MEAPERVLDRRSGPNRGWRRVASLAEWDWPADVVDQERSFGWLGRHTKRSASAVARYASGSLTPPESWLRDAAVALGADVAE